MKEMLVYSCVEYFPQFNLRPTLPLREEKKVLLTGFPAGLDVKLQLAVSPDDSQVR